VVDPALRISGSLAPGIAVQLAAGAGALAFALVNQSEDENGLAIFSAGSRDKQYQVLSRLGLRPVSGTDPVVSTEYDDVIRVMYCTNAQQLQSRFRRMMDAMAETIGLDQMIPTSAIHGD
jgi:alpha-D-ribose 1-methylphosphonate 5-triphosphate synthase subunit PhnH